MPRYKAAKNCEIKPWLSARSDCREGRFIQVGDSFLLSSALTADNLSMIYGLSATVQETHGRVFTIFENENHAHKLFF